MRCTGPLLWASSCFPLQVFLYVCCINLVLSISHDTLKSCEFDSSIIISSLSSQTFSCSGLFNLLWAMKIVGDMGQIGNFQIWMLLCSDLMVISCLRDSNIRYLLRQSAHSGWSIFIRPCPSVLEFREHLSSSFRSWRTRRRWCHPSSLSITITRST